MGGARRHRVHFLSKEEASRPEEDVEGSPMYNEIDLTPATTHKKVTCGMYWG
jgi:hypothetical protein